MATTRTNSCQLAYRDSTQHGQTAIDSSTFVLGPIESDLPFGPRGTKLIFECVDRTLCLVNAGEYSIRVNGRELVPGETSAAQLPAFITGGQFSLVCFQPIAPEEYGVERAKLTSLCQTAQAVAAIQRSPAPETLARWFASLGQIQREAACSPSFYQAAVGAMVTPGGLDAALLLMRNDEHWEVAASEIADPPYGIEFEPYLIDLAAECGETLFHSVAAEAELCDAVAKFASPVFDEARNVVGVMYGSRRQTGDNRRRGVRPLEALWLQLVSEAVSTGIARRKHEADATRRQVLLEQAFPPSIARQLSAQPDFDLVAEEREVTILFADLVGSSTLCEELDLKDAYHLLADVMDALTRGVHDHSGVIVDYYGDGLVAMWNAPIDQPMHAIQACRAGLAALAELPKLNEAWQARLKTPIQFGIGIHTGKASVGNSGSRQRVKYGPRGLCVNVASRIEKATRRVGAPLVVSKATWDQVNGSVLGYRLGLFRLVGIEEPVELYSLPVVRGGLQEDGDFTELLELLESGQVAVAASKLDSFSDHHLDEMLLQFLRHQVELYGDQVRLDDTSTASEWVFDLRE